VKILHIIHSANPAHGGPIEGIKQLVSVKLKMGITVELVCLDPPDAPWLVDFPIKVYPLGPSYSSYGYCPRLAPWLKAHCRDYAFIIINGIWQYHSFSTWRAVRRAGVPYFVFTHGMLDPWFKRHYPLKHLKKWLYWPWAEYRVLRDADKVLFTCQEEQIQARRSFWLYRCNEAVVSYGTAGWSGDAGHQKKLFFEQFPDLNGKRIILFLGRVHEKKGCDLMINAFHRLLEEKSDPSLHLVIAGPDESAYALWLKKLVHSYGLESRVTWTGMIGGDLKWGAFQSAEVFILSSHQENFGISVAESLSASLPVLITNKVNIWREIEKDDAGLVENDDSEGAYALLNRWMSLNPSGKEAMRCNARRCFVENFEIQKAAQSLLGVYDGALYAKTGGHLEY
jgi:glycosyltransferase involved in cell wall biosynthesis